MLLPTLYAPEIYGDGNTCPVCLYYSIHMWIHEMTWTYNPAPFPLFL